MSLKMFIDKAALVKDDPNFEITIQTPTTADIFPSILEPLVAPADKIFGETGGTTSLSSSEGSANTAPSLEASPAVGGTARFIIGGVGAAVGVALLLSIF